MKFKPLHDRVLIEVLDSSENRYSGTGKELLNDPRVRSSFLGG